MAVNHLCVKIESALELSDFDLWEMFKGSTTLQDGAEVRAHLEARKNYGDIYLGSENCEGFSSKTGCPGHEPKVDAEMPCTYEIIVRALYQRKAENNSICLYELGIKCGIQTAINMIHKMYAKELEVSNG